MTWADKYLSPDNQVERVRFASSASQRHFTKMRTCWMPPRWSTRWTWREMTIPSLKEAI